MTTNTTNSQAASMAEDYEFINLAANYGMAWTGTKESERKHLKALAAYIDTKLAQAREEGRRDSHETNVTMLNLKLKAEDRAATAEAKLAAWDKIVEASLANDYATRAIAAESRLAEIQRGVDEIRGPYQPTTERDAGWRTCHEQIRSVVAHALLQPQGQADTSGLPG